MTADLSAEAARAVAAEGVLQDNIDAEAARAVAAEGVLTANLSAEVVRATAAEGVLTADLSAEVIARGTGDAALDTRVTTVESQVNGKIGSLSGLSTDAKTTIVAAINEVDAHADQVAADLQVEVDRALAAETAVQVAAAADASTKADYALSTANNYTDAQLVLEHNARIANGVSSDSALAAEVTRATAAEGVLTADLSSEVSRATAAEVVLQANIDAEASDRAIADAAIRSDYNAHNFAMQSSVAATTHVVAHNLAAGFVTFTVMVERADGSYRNDIVSVEEVDSNTLKVYLAEASKIKIAVHSMSDI